MHTPSNDRKLQRLLTAKDVEALTKLSVKTIFSYAQRGLIPHVRIESSVRFPEDDIRVWIEERTYRPRSRKPKEPAAEDDGMAVAGNGTAKERT